jgi:hypothetical protein
VKTPPTGILLGKKITLKRKATTQLAIISFYEHGNEPSGEFPDQLTAYWLLKDSVPWS